MTPDSISATLANGTITYTDHSEHMGDIRWTPHPKFSGVYLKHIIKGRDTSARFSAHIVKIEPGCTLEEHCHDGQWELHEVIGGDGTCRLAGHPHSYHVGEMAVIPEQVPHQVQAGEHGLMILAKFFPALL